MLCTILCAVAIYLEDKKNIPPFAVPELVLQQLRFLHESQLLRGGFRAAPIFVRYLITTVETRRGWTS